MRYLKICPVFAVTIWVTVFLIGCEPTEKQTPVAEVIRPVKTMVLVSQEIEHHNRHPGKVRAYQHAELTFRVSGTLIQLPVKDGQEVEKNALLARLDPRDYKTNLAKVKSAIAQARAQLKAMKAGARPEDVKVLQAEVAAAKARFQEARRQYQRYQDLWNRKVISKADYDRQESAYNVAQAQLNTAEQNLQKGKTGARPEDIEAMESNISGLEAQQAEAQDALKDTYLKAPFAGVVAKKLVENFQNVQAKEPILILQDISRLDIVINVSEQIVLHAEKSPEFYEFVAVFETVPDREFPLTVKEYSTEADPKTQTYRAVLTMQAPKDLNIFPGMTATVIVSDRKIQDVAAIMPTSTFLIPVHAIFVDELNQKYVWIVEQDSMVVQKRKVEVKDLMGESIQLIKGVQAGERIVTAGIHFLQPGMKIRLLDNNGY